MNAQTKAIIKSGLLSGIIFAGLMAGSDYAAGQDFRIWKFISRAGLFGLFIAIWSTYNLKKQADKDNGKQG
ncbi:hypothetical protein [Mariniflexile sp.]|uniref:hypothetical protein n=1 Tax=Mariniflexile sp. TaxID=1979402 RepID=UPI0035693AB3